MKFDDAIKIIESHGFELKRQRGSHAHYEGFVNGKRHVVTIACHNTKDDIPPKTLRSIIRQSGLGKRAFK